MSSILYVPVDFTEKLRDRMRRLIDGTTQSINEKIKKMIFNKECNIKYITV